MVHFMENHPIKWMISGHPHLRKPPYDESMNISYPIYVTRFKRDIIGRLGTAIHG
jgi:hypothetical protein